VNFASETQAVQITGFADFEQPFPSPCPSFCACCGDYIAPECGQVRVNGDGVPELLCDLCKEARVKEGTTDGHGLPPTQYALCGGIGQHAANQGPCRVCESPCEPAPGRETRF